MRYFCIEVIEVEFNVVFFWIKYFLDVCCVVFIVFIGIKFWGLNGFGFIVIDIFVIVKWIRINCGVYVGRVFLK